MLLSLDECSDNLIDIVNARGLHDRLEGLLNDLGVSHVLIEQALLLDVLVSN